LSDDFQDAHRDYDVLDTTIEDGEYRSKLGDHAKGEGRLQDVPHWGLTGVVAIPDPPDGDGACEARVTNDGAESRILQTRDNRNASKLGALLAGARGFITRGAARFLLNPIRAQIISYTERLADGQTMLVDLDGEDGIIRHTNGGTIIEQYDDKIVFMVNGGATLTISKEGVFITGKNFQATAAIVQLGDMGGGVPPPAIPPLTSVGVGTSPAVIPSKTVFSAI